VDIISFDLTEKLPFHLKRGPVTEAIKKGIMFEVTYSQAIEGILGVNTTLLMFVKI